MRMSRRTRSSRVDEGCGCWLACQAAASLLLVFGAMKKIDAEKDARYRSIRSAYCDVSIRPEGLQECLPRLIPTLVSNMVYTEDDESLVDAEDIKDRNQEKGPFWLTTIFPWHMSDVRPLIRWIL